MLQGVLVDLVPWTQAVEDRMVGWMNGALAEWWLEERLLTRAARRRWNEEYLARPQRNDTFFGVRAKDGALIGVFGLDEISATHRYAEVGAGIGEPDYWGGGFGSDAMLLTVEYAFEWLDLRRLWLITSGRNKRAQRQVEKCGFTLEAQLRQDEFYEGRYHGSVMYGLLREEWPGREAMVERLGLREKARARGYL